MEVLTGHDELEPIDFAVAVDELVACAGLDPEAVRRRLWREALGCGNVAADAAAFGVTPHTFDAAMERFYRESDAFIFETYLYTLRPSRVAWIRAAFRRIQRYAHRTHTAAHDVRVLMFGDGSGSDSLFLARHGLRVDYFDLPASRTFAFALKRFERAGLSGSAIRIVPDESLNAAGRYDVVLSFEVLEHLTDPKAGLRALARALKPGGIALVTDAFGALSKWLPTHLASNYVYRGTTPYLALREGLQMRWSNPADPFKPMEFEKVSAAPLGRYRWLWTNPPTLAAALRLARRGRWSDLQLL